MAEPRATAVTVVTDSTADLPPALRDPLGIVVVPLLVRFGEETFRDGVDLTPEAFLQRLRTSSTLPKTSQPAVSDFEAVFRAEREAGHDVVCITISAELSGTHNSARLAAEAVDPAHITVIDSRAVTMQLGWIAVTAARAAQGGASFPDVADAARTAITRAKLFAVLQTLEYVHRGGRIGRASQLVGSALAIKPVLTLVDGIVTPLERVRTWKRAVRRGVELAIEQAPLSDVVVMHTDNLPDAEEIATSLHAAAPSAAISIAYAGSVLGTYAGPGAIGIALLKAE
ncbi:MAG: DegV family protein [Chloroflexota bacterium]|nr:DegV family protein [Chloroflexota bacterium]